MVAGGAGGKSWSTASSSVGGGLVGGDGPAAAGATQRSGGAFGVGTAGSGAGSSDGVGGGGGGYWGGTTASASNGDKNSGSGGSGFISGYAGVNAITSVSDSTHTNNTRHYSEMFFLKGEMQSGVRTGDGFARITYRKNMLPRTNDSLSNVRYVKDCINGSSMSGNNLWAEIQIIKNGVNLAKGKTVIATSPENNNTNYSYTSITDGMFDNIESSGNFGRSADDGLQCVTIDLGSVTQNIDEIAVWHYWKDGRTFIDNITYVSTDNSTWIPVIVNEEAETANGSRITAWDEQYYNPSSGDFEYIGGITQTYTAPETGYYLVEAWGAQGGANTNYSTYITGGKGGYSKGYINLTAGDTLYVNVGGKGKYTPHSTATLTPGGWNGGGDGYGHTDKTVGSGGGATDIRLVNDDWNNITSLKSRILVAGGGGGASYTNTSNYYGYGGYGGTLIAGTGERRTGSLKLGAGGAQSVAGDGYVNNGGFGYGAYYTAAQGSGAGGGWYGGGAGTQYIGSGGGSSFISGYAGVNATNQVSPNLNNVRYIKNCINGSTANTGNHWVELEANGSVYGGGTINYALGIMPTIDSGSLTSGSYITNGNTTSSQYASAAAGTKCITVDLGSAKNLESIKIWHYYSDSRTYNDNVTYVSTNGTTWTTVYNKTYAETSAGLTIDSSTMIQLTHSDNTIHYSGKYFVKGEMTAGDREGHGKARIRYVGSAPARVNTSLEGVRYVQDCVNGSSKNANNLWVELQVIKDGVNLAKGKTVTGTGTFDTTLNATYITDGIIDNVVNSVSGMGYITTTGLQCVTIDLEDTYDVDEIAVWHYTLDDRIFYNNVTRVSSDNQHWLKVIDNDDPETVLGKRVTVWEEPLQSREYYNCSGNYETFTAAQTGYYKIEAWGAASGKSNNTTASKVRERRPGAYASGYINLTAGDTLYVYVGCRGADSAWGLAGTNQGGYNGGGNGYNANTVRSGAGGGGATDIRLVSGDWNNATSLNSRILVAGGGGGSYSDGNSGVTTGGIGSSYFGGNGSRTGDGTYVGPGGGAQDMLGWGNTSYGSLSASTTQYIGAFGIGGTGANSYGGGGGGYYGGGSGNYNGGAGGSSFISGHPGVNAIASASDTANLRTHTDNTLHYSGKYFVRGEMASGVSEDDGKAKITYIGSMPRNSNTDLNGVRYVRDCIAGSENSAWNSWIELQAIQNGVNLAKGKTVTATGTAVNNYNYTYVTDGKLDNIKSTTGASTTYYGSTHDTGSQCVSVDLGDTYNLDEIAVWHWFEDGRRYYGNITSVSSDNTNWKPVIANDDAETMEGKHVTAWDEPISGTGNVVTFTYSGQYRTSEDPVPRTGSTTLHTDDWKIYFLSSGTLRFTLLNEETDIFAVGGGGSGSEYGDYGAGGGGGYTTTLNAYELETGVDYTITIGAGAAGVNTSNTNGKTGGTTSLKQDTTTIISAAGGQGGQDGRYTYTPSGGGTATAYYSKGGNGGSGGGASLGVGGSNGSNGGNCSTAIGGTGQGTTTREFGDPDGLLYAGGGGGSASKDGGLGGGAQGGCRNCSTNAPSGTPNTGGGGGGFGATGAYSGYGGSGIVIMRGAKSIMVNNVNIGKYTGTYSIETDSDNNNYIKFLTSGYFKPVSSMSNVDVFLVGGGYNGSGSYYATSTIAGNGGAGGKTYTGTANITGGEYYEIVIGGAGGGATTGFDLTSANGTSKSGGAGGRVFCNATTQYGTNADAGTNGVYAFGNSSIDGIKYGAGGGGGGAYECSSTGSWAQGGTTGGGRGGSDDVNGYQGTNGTGSGGGGAGILHNSSNGNDTKSSAGKGGTGVVIIKLR